jgi:hypothetical protein
MGQGKSATLANRQMASRLQSRAIFLLTSRSPGRRQIKKRLAPLVPTMIWCTGLNYKFHAQETNSKMTGERTHAVRCGWAQCATTSADRSPGEAGGRDGIPYRIDPDGRITIHRRNVGISSTLAWSPDGRRFYFGDSLASVIWAYDYVPQTGDVSNESPFLENFSRGLPDGSTVD